jgi:hypothetical protein
MSEQRLARGRVSDRLLSLGAVWLGNGSRVVEIVTPEVAPGAVTLLPLIASCTGATDRCEIGKLLQSLTRSYNHEFHEQTRRETDLDARPLWPSSRIRSDPVEPHFVECRLVRHVGKQNLNRDQSGAARISFP